MSSASRRPGERSRSARHLRSRLLIALATSAAVVALVAGCTTLQRSAEPTPAELEEAVRLRALALAEMENERYDRAVPHLEQLARLLPNNVLPPVNLAICYSRLNRADEALEQVAVARAIDPENPSMLYTLARILEELGDRKEEWLEIVRQFAAAHPYDVRPYYLEAEALARDERFAEAISLLQRALEEEPENLVLLSDLLVAAAAEQNWEAISDALNALEDRLNGFDGSLAAFARDLRAAVILQDRAAVRPPALIVRNLLRPGELYQVHLAPLVGGRQVGGGMFPQIDFDPPLPESIQGGRDIDFQFVDASAELPSRLTGATPLAVVREAPDREAILASVDGGLVSWRPGHSEPSAFRAAVPDDSITLLQAFDGDELPDLVTASATNGLEIAYGVPQGFGESVAIAGPAGDGARITDLQPLDVDHDGDLDLFAARRDAPDLYFQNNGDRSWTERAAELGIAGEAETTGESALADFDDDGDLDLLVTRPGSSPRLFLNQRTTSLTDGSSTWGLSELVTGGRVATGDIDNDGRFDLIVWGESQPRLLLNRGQRFDTVAVPEQIDAPWSAAAVADFDNDGDLDLVAVPADSETAYFVRGDRGVFSVESSAVPVAGARRLLSGDFDGDGDLDLIADADDGGLGWARNDGGNRNHWLRLVLRGRLDNNSKNNVDGLFSRIEARAGGAFQATLANGVVNHLGLGARRQVEVLRVVWTNGLAQLWQLVSADRTLVEEQMLKGSCPFLYAWNGNAFEFVTDLMWKSPLGMSLADGSAAPHQSARDFVLIPGEMLRPAGDELWLQVTEELWETAYVDRQRLLAVDRPADVELVVDESFRPPPYPSEPPLHWIERALEPVAAADHRGRDVLAEIAARDGRHVDDLPVTRFQGLTERHALVLTFEDVPTDERLRLVLSGWTFPTDTSINVALSQNPTLRSEGPSLELLAEDGSWRTIRSFIGFPNGKRKSMVVEVTGELPAGRVTIRLATSMQIYWDSALLALGDPHPARRIQALDPTTADLHYRGYSRLYRETSSGPHLFDYADVSIGPRFRDMRGRYTRFGKVGELLLAEDDRYVVMNAGDEMTIRYNARALEPLPPGWRRDWILYTDGWVKDADINTTHSQTVEPLPFHGQQGYPDPTDRTTPRDADDQSWLERYQTRVVDDRPFREALSPGR